jgi:predicted SnoaL-like aldol condensation-catalyzing enzyme
VHENVGVLVEGDLLALRTLVTGTHTGDTPGSRRPGAPDPDLGRARFRVRDDQLVERWQVLDTYRILVAFGAIPRAANLLQQMFGVDESPGGLFQERLGTAFGVPAGRAVTREESRAVVRRLYDDVIATGRTDDADMLAEGCIQNSGWTPDGRSAFASALAISRGAMPDGRAVQTHVVGEGNRLASRSVWDGTLTESGRPVDFTTLDFFHIEDGLIAEHWESVDWRVRTGPALYRGGRSLPKSEADSRWGGGTSGSSAAGRAAWPPRRAPTRTRLRHSPREHAAPSSPLWRLLGRAGAAAPAAGRPQGRFCSLAPKNRPRPQHWPRSSGAGPTLAGALPPA